MSAAVLVAALLTVAAAGEWRARRRAELVARACHELRRPLAAARLAVAAIERAGAGPSATVAALDLELGRCGSALDDLAAAGRGRRGRARRGAVDVTALLETQVASWRLVAAASGRELRLAALPRGARLSGDAGRLGQAVANLVDNALEHGRGPVEIGARRVPGGLRLEVRDAGPGLPAPLDEITRHARGGLGLRGRGLAIAAGIAREHGGRLVAAGAVVALELPVREKVPVLVARNRLVPAGRRAAA